MWLVQYCILQLCSNRNLGVGDRFWVIKHKVYSTITEHKNTHLNNTRAHKHAGTLHEEHKQWKWNSGQVHKSSNTEHIPFIYFACWEHMGRSSSPSCVHNRTYIIVHSSMYGILHHFFHFSFLLLFPVCPLPPTLPSTNGLSESVPRSAATSSRNPRWRLPVQLRHVGNLEE